MARKHDIMSAPSGVNTTNLSFHIVSHVFHRKPPKDATMSEQTLLGTCARCGEHIAKDAMTAHHQECERLLEPIGTGKPVRLFQVRIEDAYAGFYWMDAEIKANSTLDALDDFLRARWLECCGHLSSFTIDGTNYEYPPAVEMGMFADPTGMYDSPEGRSMNVQLSKVLGPGTTFEHIYDFGTSTELNLSVTGERQGTIGGRTPIRLLSSNHAPDLRCDECGEQALEICTACMYEKEHPFYCADHSEDHDCVEAEVQVEMLLPIVNSPRMGVCAYEGPFEEVPSM